MGACGSWAGYKRHENAKEPSCGECKKAAAVYQARLRADRRLKSVDEVAAGAAAIVEVDVIDAAAEGLETLRILRAAMKKSPVNKISAFSKERRELVAFVSKHTDFDVLKDTRENLRIVTAALKVAPVDYVPALAGARRALIALRAELEKPREVGGVHDELAATRAEREARRLGRATRRAAGT